MTSNENTFIYKKTGIELCKEHNIDPNVIAKISGDFLKSIDGLTLELVIFSFSGCIYSIVKGFKDEEDKKFLLHSLLKNIDHMLEISC